MREMGRRVWDVVRDVNISWADSGERFRIVVSVEMTSIGVTQDL